MRQYRRARLDSIAPDALPDVLQLRTADVLRQRGNVPGVRDGAAPLRPAGRPAPEPRRARCAPKLAMACRELDADAALLSEIRDGREHVRWGAGGYAGVVAPLRDTICERLLDGRIGSVVHDTTAEPALAIPPWRRRHPRLHRRARSRPRTRAPTCSAAWRTRRGRTSGRPTCASCRAWRRACARARAVRRGSRSRRPCWSPRLRWRRQRRRGDAGAAGGGDRPAAAACACSRSAPSTSRCTSPRRPATASACSSSSRAARSARAAAARSSTAVPRRQRPHQRGRRARPAVARLRARLRADGLFYVYYTDPDGDARVVEYQRRTDDEADPGSARRCSAPGLRAQPQRRPAAVRARRAALHRHGRRRRRRRPARPDRQRPVARHAARQDPAHRPAPLRLAAVLGPASNPFVGRTGARPEIYSYGLRNPWRFSFDRQTGDLTIGDVGQNAIEEINFVRRGKGRGANFGWRVFEGNDRYTDGERRPARSCR